MLGVEAGRPRDLRSACFPSLWASLPREGFCDPEDFFEPFAYPKSTVQKGAGIVHKPFLAAQQKTRVKKESEMFS